MKAFKLPLWTKALPNHANITSKDILNIFGYKGVASVSCHIQQGRLPKPDGKTCRNEVNRKAKNMWSMGYLRRLELEQESHD